MFKAFKLQKWKVFFFLKCPYFSTKCAPFLLKIKEDLTFMIRMAKGLELMRIFFKTNLNTFGSNVFLILKIMDFENVASIKVLHIYVIKDMNA